MKVIKRSFCIIFFLLGCKQPCVIMGDPNSTKHEVLLYNVTHGDSTSWFHDLVVTNYKQNELSTKDLYEMAKRYKDTCKKNIPIGMISFFAQKKNGCVPDLKYRTNGLDKISIIDFSFQSEENAKDSNYNVITIWKNRKYKSYYRSLNEAQFDSVLNSPVPLETGIN